MIVSALVLSALLAQAGPPMQGPPPPPQSAGDKLLASGDFDGALAAYTAANKADAKDANALLGIGTIDLYRNDLPDAKTYLTAAARLNPADPRTQARLRALDGRFADQTNVPVRNEAIAKFIVTDPLPLLHVTVNGKQLTFLLDTGGPGVDIAADTAKKIGLKMVAAGQGTFAGGQMAQMHRTHLASVSVAGATLKNVDAGVLPGEPMSMGGHHVDGVLGTGFLSHFIATIDYKHGQLVLRPRSVSAAFLANAQQHHATILPMWLVSDHFIFAKAHVGNAPTAIYNIDTGGGGMGVQLTKAQLDAAQITVDPSKASSFMGGGGATRAIPFTAPSVTLGSLTKSNVPGLYFPDGDQYGIFPFAVGGTLSHEFFKGTALTFDFVSMQLIVTS